MTPRRSASSVVAMYASCASAEDATDELQRAGLDGNRISVVSFHLPQVGALGYVPGPYFVLARGPREVLQHARLVLDRPGPVDRRSGRVH